jgi:hypothetical protein
VNLLIVIHYPVFGGPHNQALRLAPVREREGVSDRVSTFTGKVGVVSTVVNNFRIVGAGDSASLQVHENVAVVVNANGTLTASIDHVSVTCS